MSEGAYSALSRDYDRLNSETDYGAWADFIIRAFDKFGRKKIHSVLDLGCGTGAMTFALRERGCDMTGVDISPEMLSVARETCDEKGISDILWLCQDMRAFELYGTVEAAVCCLDGINHLTGAGDLARCLSLVHNYLEPDGLFIFDVNTPHKFRYFYGQNDYILEDEGVVCCWQNSCDKRRGICDFFLTVFEENSDGTWNRTDTVQREKCYGKRMLRGALERAGFEVCGFYSDFGFSEASEDCDRWYIAARAIKE